MVEQELKTIVYPLTPFKVGTFILMLISVIIIIMKVMIHYGIGLTTGFYSTLQAFLIVLPFFLAIALILIFLRFLKNYLYLIISFVIFLVLGFLFITPLLIGGT